MADPNDSPAVRAADAIAGVALDVMMPAEGKAGHGTSTPKPTGDAALDAALKDPTAQKGIALAMTTVAATGVAGGIGIGIIMGAGLMGLTWGLWPKGKR